MKKRMTASILALCLLLSTLTGCGHTPADDFFDVIDAIIALDNYHLELTVSSDQESKNGFHLSGDIAETRNQAQLTLTGFSEQTKADGKLDIVVDGDQVYVRPGAWATYLSKRFPSLGEGIERDSNALEGELLNDAAKDLGKSWYQLSAPEPVFDLLHGISHKDAYSALTGWYQGLRKSLKKDIQSENGIYTLSLEGDRLREQQLSRLNHLIEKEETYRKALYSVFSGAEDAITASGWSDSDILDTMWSSYAERRETLNQSKKDKKEQKSKVTVSTHAMSNDNTYQVSAEWTDGEVDRYLQASIQPAEQTVAVTVPKKAISYSEQAENLAMVFLDTRNLVLFRPGSASGSENVGDSDDGSGSIDWNKWAEEHPDDTQENSVDLETTAIEENKHTALTAMETEDGVQVELPIVTDYSYCDATAGEDGSTNALGLTSDAWQVDIYSLEKEGRSMQDILSESISAYVDIYQNDYEYEITQKPDKLQVNQDKTACTCGFRYFDTDQRCEITMVSIVHEVKNSNFVMIYEFSIYSDQVKEDHITGLEELCAYYNLTLPVTIAQQES